VPFHAAEQRSKELKYDSAEQGDFPNRPFFTSSTVDFAKSETAA
jgi:hypothetical protein